MRRRWSLSFVLALFLAWGFCFCGGITGGNDGLTLVEIKKSFRNVDDILYDWTGAASSDYCFWRGITCDNITFEVISLNFSGLNLDGEISPAIGNLRSLVTLDLKSNQLSGQIPDEIGDCSLLETL
ncbi:LRR receptor-like serine/threonine-protein kinase ERECTA [Dendrobium catenatum]|uniref:LRR receptor-like serine/threonine-protein kinase ERECTA n=3 Tax=Dendrobium catenatum TaxID=906689 RepID=A0A2I0VIX0_9ASPA|nr:LRR receptor-like serine/threonine-protein kinase ERECTA [Dendrobium catenatum]